MTLMNRLYILLYFLLVQQFAMGQAQPPSWACRDLEGLASEQFDSLRVLYLYEKELQIWPEEMKRAKGLNRLWLCKMEQLDLPYILDQLLAHPQLEQLFLSKNELQMLPEQIGELQSLRILHLDHNELDQLPKSLEQLQELEELHLGYNQLQQLPQWLEDLPKLKKLYVQGNPLSKETDESRAAWEELFKDQKIQCQWKEQ